MSDERQTDRATVSVGGEGSVSIEPDSATISVGVDVTEDTVEEARATANQQMTSVLDAAKGAGVADHDLKTSRFSVSVVQKYDRQRNPIGILGYRVANQITITVRDLNSLPVLLSTVTDAGANNVWGPHFYVDDPSAATSQARRLAMADARTKADELAAAAGVSITGVFAIAEGSDASGRDYRLMEDSFVATSAPPIEHGTIDIEVQVRVIYDIG